MFDALARIGPADAKTLAGVLDCPVDHLRCLLDGVAAQGLLDHRVNVYELNDTARRYLTSDSPASMASLVAVAPGPQTNWTMLAETVRKGRPATPIEDDPAAFYVPLARGTFTTMLRCATRADLKIRFSALHAPQVLDLGAGGAPWSIAILKACSGATAVVNDLAAVIDVARDKATAHGVVDRCCFRPGDFKTIDIEDDTYDIVVLGHVCRAEGADGARHLIERAYRALVPEGRLLLADYFAAAEPQRNPHAALMGVTMMAATTRGFTFTHQEYSQWLVDARFVDLRLIEPIGFQQVFVATKPRHRNAPELPAPLNAKTCAGPTAVRADPRKGQPWNR